MKKQTLIRRSLFTLLLICTSAFSFLFFAITKSANIQAQAYTSVETLSEMSEGECLNFIIDNGVVIPQEFSGKPIGEFIKSIIQSVEADPNQPISFNNRITYDFAESIRSVVNKYYSLDSTATTSYSTRATTILTDNVLYGVWNDTMYHYNCYAYAIKETELPPNYPSDHYQHQPGDFAGTGSFWDTDTIYELALVVKDDLESLGRANVTLSYSMPANPTSFDNLIAIRRAWWDYHFMRFNQSDSFWYHKPGPTSILKYLRSQSNSVPWVYEGVYGNGTEFHSSYYTYDSDIVYITYDCQHDFQYQMINSSLHTKFCTKCDYSEEFGHSFSYTPIYNELHITKNHRKRCTLCSYEKIEGHIRVNNIIVCCVIGEIMKAPYNLTGNPFGELIENSFLEYDSYIIPYISNSSTSTFHRGAHLLT